MSAASSEKDVSCSPSAFVYVYRVSPEDDDPTASTFLPMPGLLIVHEVLTVSPSFPAAKINRCWGFFARGGAVFREVGQGQQTTATPVDWKKGG